MITPNCPKCTKPMPLVWGNNILDIPTGKWTMWYTFWCCWEEIKSNVASQSLPYNIEWWNNLLQLDKYTYNVCVYNLNLAIWRHQ